MTRATSLDAIIRLLSDDDDQDARGPAQQIVCYDPGTKQVVENRRSLGGILRRRALRRYQVTFDVNVDHAARSVDLGDAIRRGGSIEVKVQCFVSCPRGKEEKLVKVVAEQASVGAVLDEIIAYAMKQHAAQVDRRGEDVVASILTDPDAWSQEVARRVSARTGLEATFVFDLARKPERKEAREAGLEVTVKDSDERLIVHYGVDLEPQDHRQALQSFERAARLQDDLRDTTRRWFSECVTLDEFCLRQGRVRDAHRDLAETKARDVGYKVSWHKLDFKAPFDVPEPTSQEWIHACRIKDWEQRVQVQHNLRVEVTSVQKLRAARVADLKGWFEKLLRDTTEAILFDASYCDVATRFRPHASQTEPCLEEQIKDRIADFAEQIGCRVVQHSSTPNIEPVRYLDGFDLDELRLKLRPKDGREEVEVTLATRGRLTDLRAIQHLIRPDESLVKQMKDFLAAEARHFMYGVTLREFYLGFEPADPPLGPVSLEERLSRHLAAKLKEQFRADAAVTVRQEATGLIDRWHDLTEQQPSFDVQVRPREGEPITIHIGYQVTEVSPDHWNVFIRRRAPVAEEIQAISKLIHDHIETKLSRTLPPELIAFRDPAGQERLQQVLFRGVPKQAGARHVEGAFDVVKRLHGVCIEITKFVRSDTALDVVRDQVTTAELESQQKLIVGRSRSRAEEVEILNGKIRNELAERDPDLEQVARWRKERDAMIREAADSGGPSGAVRPHALLGSGDPAGTPDPLERALSGDDTPRLAPPESEDNQRRDAGRLRPLPPKERNAEDEAAEGTA